MRGGRSLSDPVPAPRNPHEKFNNLTGYNGVMYRSTALLALLLSLTAACASTNEIATYEHDDLISVQHNDENSYTLLIYRDAVGQTRHVLRRSGICELVVTYTLTGDILMKERGEGERVITAVEASRLTHHINTLIGIVGSEKPREHLSSI